jgi:hypothetical protein
MMGANLQLGNDGDSKYIAMLQHYTIVLRYIDPVFH